MKSNILNSTNNMIKVARADFEKPYNKTGIAGESKKLQESKKSSSKTSILKCPTIDSLIYSVFTRKGRYSTDNEDRVSVVTPIQLNNMETMHYFALFDGHGGSKCAQYFSKRLLQNILKDFDSIEVYNSMKKALMATEHSFFNDIALDRTGTILEDRSGACCVIGLVLNNFLYICNIGNCRGLILEKGKTAIQINEEHNLKNVSEAERVLKNGGKIVSIYSKGDRIVPGYINVTRSLGDFHLKHRRFGGVNNVIINEASFYTVNLSNQNISVFLATDGVFDYLSNKAIESIFDSATASEFNSEIESKILEKGGLDDISFIRFTNRSI